MNDFRKKVKMGRIFRGANVLIGAMLVALLSAPAPAVAAANLAVINGIVRDSSGAPLIGALVVIGSSAPALQRMVFTDQRGAFSVPNLFAGQYSVKVTMPKFLPASKTGIQLSSGGTAILTVNLQTAMDVVRRAMAGAKSQNQDIVWTLRSSRSSQPLLHLTDDGGVQKDVPAVSPEYSGNWAFYSQSVETPVGIEEGVGSEFSVNMPFDPKTKLTVAGLYSDVPTQPRGVEASYEYSPSDRRHSEVAIGVKQGDLSPDLSNLYSVRDIQVDYKGNFQWSDHIVLQYGADAGRAGGMGGQNYLLPKLGASWAPDRRTTVSLLGSEESPVTPDDPIRGKEYLDRPTYLSPAQQHYVHAEFAGSHSFSDNVEVAAALFKDRVDSEALFFSSATGSGLLVVNTRHSPSQGVRIYVNRHFRNFEAGGGYTAAVAPVPQSLVDSLSDLQHRLNQRPTQVISTRFKADLDATQTEVTAIYRWMSNIPLSEIDPYQHVLEYNDPTLSVTIAQNLPAWRMMPGRLQAVLDARNLLNQTLGPQNLQLTQSPKFLKGGINIKF